MRARSAVATAVLTLTTATVSAQTSSAEASGAAAVAPRTSAPTAKLTAPREATQGDRISLGIRLTRPAQVRRVRVQHLTKDVFNNPTWETVKKLRPQNRTKLTYRTVAGETDRDRYRVVLERTKGRSITSKAVSVKVWHWYSLAHFPSYYRTTGVADYYSNHFAMNGRTYVGSWYTYGSYGGWESRYTLGRHCRSMSGTYGVTDSSADGSTATIQVLSEGADPVYTSPTLSPGAVDTKVVPLASPYRISILGTNTSTDGLLAYPAAGDLQFLCSGLE